MNSTRIVVTPKFNSKPLVDELLSQSARHRLGNGSRMVGPRLSLHYCIYLYIVITFVLSVDPKMARQ
jgi:hypothetical protein